MRVGRKVRRLRIDAEMSQEQLGRLMGMHQSTIAYWENNPAWSPSAENVALLCSVFGCTPDYLFQNESTSCEPA